MADAVAEAARGVESAAAAGAAGASGVGLGGDGRCPLRCVGARPSRRLGGRSGVRRGSRSWAGGACASGLRGCGRENGALSRCRALEEEQLELEAEATGHRAVGVEGRDASGHLGQLDRRGLRAVDGTAEPADDDLPEPGDQLVGEGRQVTAGRFETVEDRDPVERAATRHGRQERVDLLLVGHAQQIAHGIGGDGRDAGAEELVEHRFGVAHASGGEVGDERDGLVIGRLAVLREDPSQLALDLLDRQRSKREALQTRHHGRPDLGWVGGAEDEEDVVRRLLERLEEDVPALLDALYLVDDEDLAAQVRRRRIDAGDELAHVVDLVVRRRVHLDHVERTTLPDRLARGTGVTRLAIDDVGAVDRLGQDARHRRLAGPARADEEEAVSQAFETDGVAQGLDDGALADDLVEALGAPAPIERRVAGRRGRRRGGCRGHGGKCSPRAGDGSGRAKLEAPRRR